MFAALNADKGLEMNIGCPKTDTQGGPTPDQVQRAKSVVRSDHLSPFLAMIWPDLVRKLIPDSLEGFDEANVLERSFACAYDRNDRQSAWEP